jgi:hypothetical protein
MIDLETLGLDPVKAPIIQIAAEPFRLHQDGPATDAQPFQTFVTAGSCVRPPFNRSIEPSTVAWWARTDAALLAEIMEGRGLSLSSALAGLTVWMGGLPEIIDGVWANGATFDITMLEMAYQQEGMRVPWHFRVIRDVRTMAMIAGDDDLCWSGGTKTDIEREGKAHNATVDCLRQLRMVQQTWQRRVLHDAPETTAVVA